MHARSSSRANLRTSSTATSRAVSTTCLMPNLGNLEDFGVPGRPPPGNGEAKGFGIDWRDDANDGATDGEGLCMTWRRTLSHLAREGDGGSVLAF